MRAFVVPSQAWYYCTIQLREHILIANGSRIRPWWIWHHYYSIVLVALLVIWQDGYASRSFYPQFNWFCLYVGMYCCLGVHEVAVDIILSVGRRDFQDTVPVRAGLVQFLEFQYQRRRLYTLRALGKADAMQLSAEGAESWQSNLTYLIPFLLVGHVCVAARVAMRPQLHACSGGAYCCTDYVHNTYVAFMASDAPCSYGSCTVPSSWPCCGMTRNAWIGRYARGKHLLLFLVPLSCCRFSELWRFTCRKGRLLFRFLFVFILPYSSCHSLLFTPIS